MTTYAQTGKLVFKSYKPLKLEKGMYFLKRNNEEISLMQLDSVPFDEEEYINMNGYPVDLYIIHQGNPNLNDGYVIAEPHQIGWWDAGEFTDELYDITLKEINDIIENYDGNVDVEIEEEPDEQGYPIPTLAEGKVILSISDEEYDEDDEQEYFFDDDEEYTPPSSTEEWENQFTNPNHSYYDKDEE